MSEGEWTKTELILLAQSVGIVLVAIIGLVSVWIGRSGHILINSRMSQLLEVSTRGARAEGAAQERAESDARLADKQVAANARSDATQAGIAEGRAIEKAEGVKS